MQGGHVPSGGPGSPLETASDILWRVSPSLFSSPANHLRGLDSVAEQEWKTAPARECFSGHGDPV